MITYVKINSTVRGAKTEGFAKEVDTLADRIDKVIGEVCPNWTVPVDVTIEFPFRGEFLKIGVKNAR